MLINVLTNYWSICKKWKMFKSPLEREKKKSQSKKAQPKKISGARQVQSCGGLNRISSFTFHYRIWICSS